MAIDKTKDYLMYYKNSGDFWRIHLIFFIYVEYKSTDPFRYCMGDWYILEMFNINFFDYARNYYLIN